MALHINYWKRFLVSCFYFVRNIYTNNSMIRQEFEIMKIMRISCQDFKIAQEKYIKRQF